MQVKEAIYNRRAIKQFDADHRMTAAEEKELLEATIQAPTSFNIQHWRFVILRDPDLRAKIRKEFGIIRKIVERDVAGDSLLEDDVSREDELLHAAAIEDFGSWDTALEYSGVPARDVARSRDLGAKRTEQQLRRLCTTGYDLGAMVNRSRDRALYDAALRHHGTWRAALTAAGINLANVSRRRPENFDREAMILWLHDRRAADESLVFSEVCLEHRDKALAIKRTFGSWANAIEEVSDGITDTDRGKDI